MLDTPKLYSHIIEARCILSCWRCTFKQESAWRCTVTLLGLIVAAQLLMLFFNLRHYSYSKLQEYRHFRELSFEKETHLSFLLVAHRDNITYNFQTPFSYFSPPIIIFRNVLNPLAINKPPIIRHLRTLLRNRCAERRGQVCRRVTVIFLLLFKYFSSFEYLSTCLNIIVPILRSEALLIKPEQARIGQTS